jgi:hypothetical protein
VNLSSSPSAGAAFGSAQFAKAHIATLTIPAGQSSASFWFSAATPGSPSLTVAAPGAVSGSQVELITAAPSGLGVALDAGSTGAPVLACQAPGLSAVCTISGIGSAGKAILSIGFWNAGGVPVVYSLTQSSAITGSGPNGGTATVAPGASISGSLALPAGATIFSFGPYTLTVNVQA